MDIFHTIAAVGLFLPILIFPGYLIGSQLKIWGFRYPSLLMRLCTALVLSIATAPILIFLLWSVSVRIAEFAYWTSVIATIFYIFRTRRTLPRFRLPAVTSYIAILWLFISLFSQIDIPVGGGLYLSEVAYDQSYRTEFVAALERSQTLPPESPFFVDSAHDGPSTVPLRYHYFWFMLCGLIARISAYHVGARDVLMASVSWGGFAVFAILLLVLRFFFEKHDIRRPGLMLLGAMAIGGLQVVFLFVNALARLVRHMPLLKEGTLTWTDQKGQIAGWFDTLLWVPNHVAALVSGLAALLLLWSIRECKAVSERVIRVLLAGVAMASAVGLSVHVSFGFLAFLGVLSGVFLIKGRWKWAGFTLGTLWTAAAMAWPYLRILRASAAGGTPFLAFAVRNSDFAYNTVRSLHLHSFFLEQFVRAAFTPIVFFYELGFLLVVAVWKLMQPLPSDTTEKLRVRLLWLFVGVLFLTAFFADSSVGSAKTNDMGWRGMLGIQFVLLFWTVDFVEQSLLRPISPGLEQDGHWRRTRRQFVVILACVGICTTGTEILLLRFFTLAVDHKLAREDMIASLPKDNGVYTSDLREAFDYLRKNTPLDAVVQDNPTRTESMLPGLFMERQTATRSAEGLRFGGKPSDYMQVLLDTSAPFQSSHETLALLRQTCARTGVDYWVIQSSDGVWQDRQSWVWSEVPFYANPHVRIFSCGIHL